MDLHSRRQRSMLARHASSSIKITITGRLAAELLNFDREPPPQSSVGGCQSWLVKWRNYSAGNMEYAANPCITYSMLNGDLCQNFCDSKTNWISNWKAGREGERLVPYPPQGWSVCLSLYMTINVIVAKLDAPWPGRTNPVIRELTVLTIVGSLQSSLLSPPFL